MITVGFDEDVVVIAVFDDNGSVITHQISAAYAYDLAGTIQHAAECAEGDPVENEIDEMESVESEEPTRH